MVRLLLRLLGIRDFESCASCETLKQQLTVVNAEKRELTETLLRLVKPEVIHQSNPTIVTPQAVGATFAARRKAMEEMHARKTIIEKTSPFIAKPDNSIIDDKSSPGPIGKGKSVEQLEQELSIEGTS